LYRNRINKTGVVRFQGQCNTTSSGAPLITVITAVLNGENTLERTIQSVIGQDYKNIEYIIIDGGSADGTLDIVKKYEHAIDYWISENDGGIYDAMNKGLEASSGEWIYFLGSDDCLVAHNVLNTIAQKLFSVPDNYNIVYGDVAIVNFKKEILLRIGEPWTPKMERRFRQKMCICHQGIFHRRELFAKNGLYDKSYKISGDYELLLRELKINKPYYIGPQIIANVQEGGVSSSRLGGIELLNEVSKARTQNKIKGIPFYLYWQYTRVVIRLFIFRIFENHIARVILDSLRRFCGSKAYWSKV
jgi:glycosyltransferase involved in cell wall biosynthesis